MTNHYAFECPVKGAAVLLTDCMDVHSAVMKGRPEKVEDKKCAVAHLCWMCPARNAFRVGGPWSHSDTIPRWEEPRETPAKLPKDLLSYSLTHTLPNAPDYRRVGLRGDDVLSFNEEFAELQRRYGAGGRASAPTRSSKVVSRGAVTTPEADDEAPTFERKGSLSKPKSKAKPQNAMDAIAGAETQDMAKLVNKLAAESKRASKNAPETRSASQMGNDAQKLAAPASKQNASADDASTPKLSLAERARLMKQRKQA